MSDHSHGGSSSQPNGHHDPTGAAPTEPHGTQCSCPVCVLNYYITLVYRNQRQSSRNVMLARPSPYFQETNGIPPPPPPLTPMHVTTCPLYAKYGFCTYGKFCLLAHESQKQPLTPVPATLEEAVEAATLRAQLEEDLETWTCAVCGLEGVEETCQSQLGSLLYYRSCPRCALPMYFPHTQHIIDLIIDGVGDDYQLYKTKIEEIRAALPDILKVPLSYEAHRMGYTVFAWSLVAPTDARDAIDSAVRVQPDLEMILSVGSGTGYIEHIFNRVVNGVAASPHGPRRSLAEKSSFDGVHASFYPDKRLYLFSFDDLARPSRYSVTVNYGGPTSVLSVDCTKAVLLLCWPPFGSPQAEQSSMGFEAVEYYTQAGGKTIIYIGDIFSTGDWRMHDMMYTHFKLVKGYPVRRELRRWQPTDMGLLYSGNDTIGVYSRRETPIPPRQWGWDSTAA